MGRAFLTLFFCLLPLIMLAQSSVSVADTAKVVTRDTIAQRDIIDIVGSVLKIKPRKASTGERKKIYFSILPISSSPSDGRSGGRALFTSTTAGFYLGDQATTNLSSLYLRHILILRAATACPLNQIFGCRITNGTFRAIPV
jgi:hypothetical protein